MPDLYVTFQVDYVIRFTERRPQANVARPRIKGDIKEDISSPTYVLQTLQTAQKVFLKKDLSSVFFGIECNAYILKPQPSYKGLHFHLDTHLTTPPMALNGRKTMSAESRMTVKNNRQSMLPKSCEIN